MFRGEFTYSIDDKGRLAVPAKLREQIPPESNKTFVMGKGFSKCIDLYPLAYWQKIEEQLLRLNPFNEEHTRFLRMFSSFASDDKMDKQSRILIPKKLLEYAEIEKEVLILGALKKIEVWNPKNFEEYINSSPESYEKIAAKVMVF